MNTSNYKIVFVNIRNWFFLILIFLNYNCTLNNSSTNDVVQLKDTIKIENIIHDTLFKPFTIIQFIHDTLYIEDINEESFGMGDLGNIMLKNHYDSILQSHFNKNLNFDTIYISKNTIIVIRDTIQENRILNREYQINKMNEN